MKTSLVMLSGGVDSTYVLAEKLRETNDIVVAHHVSLRNREGRADVEKAAVRDIAAYCKAKYRPFHLTFSTVDRSGLECFGWDVISVAHEAGIAALHHNYLHGNMPDTWSLGICAEETSMPGRLPHVLNVIEAACFPVSPPQYNRPDIKPKAELIEYLGDLASLCWTCRRPVNGNGECGKCHTCRIMAQSA